MSDSCHPCPEKSEKNLIENLKFNSRKINREEKKERR